MDEDTQKYNTILKLDHRPNKIYWGQLEITGLTSTLSLKKQSYKQWYMYFKQWQIKNSRGRRSYSTVAYA